MVIDNYLNILYDLWEVLSGFARGVLNVVNSSIADALYLFAELAEQQEVILPNGIVNTIIDAIGQSPFAQDTTLLSVMFGTGITFYIGYQIFTWFGNLIT